MLSAAARSDRALGVEIAGVSTTPGDTAPRPGVGDVVGPDLPFIRGGGAPTMDRFDGNTPGDIGILFENEATGNLHSGWVEVTLPTAGVATITRYAYQATPLTALATPAPGTATLATPATPATLAALAGGLAAARRRRRIA